MSFAAAIARYKDPGFCADGELERIGTCLNLCGSALRGDAMLQEIYFAPEQIFWPMLLTYFPACDAQFHLRSVLRDAPAQSAAARARSFPDFHCRGAP
jgi:hypothetical protein